MGKKVDISNQEFGRLTARFVAKTDSRGRAFWFCECSCGGGKVVRDAVSVPCRASRVP